MSSGKATGNLIQVAALCWRRRISLEVLLVTSLRSKRWIIPKGWPHMGRSLMQAAASEAFEEAGVVGEISRRTIGQFHYHKLKSGVAIPCKVQVFSLRVDLERETWPESHKRERIWLPVQEAARRIAEPDLRLLVLKVPLLERR
jgi:8-oxo-dGTP pyrophosphatase MutT (NUDIX family)